MDSNKELFYEEDYRKEDDCFGPHVDVFLGKSKKKICAYVDTGCSTGIFVFKEQVEGIDIGSKINDELSPCIVADGDIIGGEEYLCSVIVGGEEKTITITVVDPSRKIGYEEIKKMVPLLGRDFLDHYDVLFKGRVKKLAFFK